MMQFNITHRKQSGFWSLSEIKDNSWENGFYKEFAFFYYTKKEIIQKLKHVAYKRFGIKRAHFDIYA